LRALVIVRNKIAAKESSRIYPYLSLPTLSPFNFPPPLPPTSQGYLSSMWTKSGSLKTSFGTNGYVDTKSKYVTCMATWTDDYGSGSILTGGGYDIMGR